LYVPSKLFTFARESYKNEQISKSLKMVNQPALLYKGIGAIQRDACFFASFSALYLAGSDNLLTHTRATYFT